MCRAPCRHMSGDTGIHLFLLLLSTVGMLSALLSLRRDPVLRGRLVLPTKTSGPICILLAVVGRRTIRKRVTPSGNFRLTIPSGGRAVIKIVHRRQVVRTMRVSPRADPAERPWSTRQVFDLGDIILPDRVHDHYHMRLYYRASRVVVVATGCEPERSAPADRQLLDHSGHALMHPWDASASASTSSC